MRGAKSRICWRPVPASSPRRAPPLLWLSGKGRGRPFSTSKNTARSIRLPSLASERRPIPWTKFSATGFPQNPAAPNSHDHIGGDRRPTQSYIIRIMIDPFGRTITYLRVSVTDRCDFRCVYCMAEEMNFLPKSELLTLEERDRMCGAFVRHGWRKLRLTGGEPLVRRDIMTLFHALGRHIKSGALDELTLTTNGSQLARYAAELRDCGVRRVNVSVDTLDPAKFTEITRRGRLDQVLEGLAAAKRAGLAVKINTVALRGVNEDELDELVAWAGGEGVDLVIIRVMPMGDIGGADPLPQDLPLSRGRP